MLRPIKPLIAGMIAIAMIFLASANSYAETETGNAYTYKIAVERHLEERLNKVLKEILKIEDLVVIVSAEVQTLSRDQIQKQDSQNRALLLPGVPVRERLGVEGDARSVGVQSPVVVQGLLLTVLVDESTDQSTIDSIHDVALSALDFNPDRGDRIEIRKMNFINKSFKWGTLLYPQSLITIILGIIGAIFLAAAAVFFLNPFKSLAVSIKEIDWSSVRGSDAHGDLMTMAGAQANHGYPSRGSDGESTTNVSLVTEAESNRRFGFISGENIKEAGYLLQEAPLEDIAIVLGYLSPERASKLLEMFPVQKQTEAVALLSGTKRLVLDEVEKLEKSLRDQLDLVVGGEDKLAAILDLADDDIRDRTITNIERKDLNTAIRLREKAKSLESIIRSLEKNDLQKLIGRLDHSVLARILNSVAGDIQARVLESLSDGGAERLSEEIKYAGAFPAERLKREKRKIVAIYRELIEAGEIIKSISNGMDT